MSLMEIGQTLKKERKRQQLSLEDVYATTKIGMDILRAIEEADLDQMPHLVYARGFIRNYADFLGLSGEEIVRAFDEAMEDEAVQATHRHRGSGIGRSADGKGGEKSGSKLSVGMVLLLVLVLAGLVYYFFLSPPAEQPRKANQTVAENASGEREQAEVAASEEINASSGEKATGTNRSTAAKAETSGENETADEVAESSQAGLNATALARSEAEQEGEGNRSTREDNATAQLASHELRIVASEACWINADVESGVRDFYLEPGQERTVRFRGTGSFILGNAGGVTLYLDGEEYSVQAESGEVREITLP